jgi:adenosine deaminase
MRAAILLFVLLSSLASAQSKHKPAAARSSSASAEARTSARMEAVRNQPPALRAFLVDMPKGGDLHNHLSGSIYAENYILWAAQMKLCVDKASLTYVVCKDESELKPEQRPQRPASDALTDTTLYRELIDAFSMRNHSPARKPGEYQFFDAFNKFGAATNGNTGAMLAEVAHRAALQNEHYVETMFGMDGGVPWQLANRTPWLGDSPEEMVKYRQQLLDAGLLHANDAGRQMLDAAEADMRSRLKCGSAQADPGCSVTIRYIFQVLRAFPKNMIFAQIAAGFEMCKVDKRVVALNLVQPEDWLIPMHDYDLHMLMIEVLHNISPNVNITLHAGELTFGQVPSEELGQHIKKAIEVGHAQRIGHGTDVMYSQNPAAMLKEMASKHVAVEISFSSSDGILGLRGATHPFRQYMKAGVPVAIATDDEGVARSDITNEYQRAVEEQGATYAELKRISRNSAEYSFLPGASLWADASRFKMNAACAGSSPSKLSAKCDALLKGSEKATHEWELEKDFAKFEDSLLSSYGYVIEGRVASGHSSKNTTKH